MFSPYPTGLGEIFAFLCSDSQPLVTESPWHAGSGNGGAQVGKWLLFERRRGLYLNELSFPGTNWHSDVYHQSLVSRWAWQSPWDLSTFKNPQDPVAGAPELPKKSHFVGAPANWRSWASLPPLLSLFNLDGRWQGFTECLLYAEHHSRLYRVQKSC